MPGSAATSPTSSECSFPSRSRSLVFDIVVHDHAGDVGQTSVVCRLEVPPEVLHNKLVRLIQVDVHRSALLIHPAICATCKDAPVRARLEFIPTDSHIGRVPSRPCEGVGQERVHIAGYSQRPQQAVIQSGQSAWCERFSRAAPSQRPGTQVVPARGTPAMAAASTLSAARSSGSRLCTCDLPHARASVCVSRVSTLR